MKYLMGLLLGILGVVSFNNVLAQSLDTTDTRNVRWKDRKLTLNDFVIVGPKEKKPDSTHFGGHADVWVLQRTASKGNQVRIHIVTYFNYMGSWIQKKEQKNKNVLNHLQRHFDLMEIETRNFAQAIRNYSFTDNFRKEIPVIYKTVMGDMKRMQKLYDVGTKLGTDSDMQKAWDAKIDEYLNTLPPVENDFIEFNVQ